MAEPLRVVTRDLEPFSFDRATQRVGFAAELWDNVAREIGATSSWSVAPTAKDVVARVQGGQADVGVGALSITAEREKIIDFSQPFYESGLQILVSKTDGGITDVIWSVVRSLFTWQLVLGVTVTILVMLVISHLVWLFEHRINDGMWPPHYLAGMAESFWWTLSTFLVGGADNKGPIGLGGRIVATIWMLASVIAVSLLTASLSALLTVNSLTSDINSPNDLPGRKVATIGGSLAETWLQKFGATAGKRIDVKTYATVQECLAALRQGEVKAVVYDAPVLKYYTSKMGPDAFMLMGVPFEKNNYGFALPQDSPLRERINQALLTLNEKGITDELRRKWFGADE